MQRVSLAFIFDRLKAGSSNAAKMLSTARVASNSTKAKAVHHPSLEARGNSLVRNPVALQRITLAVRRCATESFEVQAGHNRAVANRRWLPRFGSTSCGSYSPSRALLPLRKHTPHAQGEQSSNYRPK